MRRPTLPGLLVGIAAVALVAALWLSGRAQRSVVARCRQLQAGLGPHATELRSEVGLDAAGRVSSAGQLGCDGAGASSFVAALEAQASLPASLRPRELRVYQVQGGSQVRGLEFDPAARAILATHDVFPAVAWLHEVVHAAAHGERPRSLIGARLYAALDEGVADYLAAVTSGSSQLPPSGRDLREPPKLGESDWAMLGLPMAPFDPHSFGWSLAARFYTEDRQGRALAEPLVECLRGARFDGGEPRTPRTFLDSVVASCPQASRVDVERLLRAWMPAVLLGEGA